MAGHDSGAGAGSARELRVQVAAGLPGRQEVLLVTLPAGSTVIDAVSTSRILEGFPELRAVELAYAVHGVRASADQLLVAGDRVELLRPLRVDPRESRRRRARRRS